MSHDILYRDISVTYCKRKICHLENLSIQWCLNASTVRSGRQLHITHVTHHPCHTDTLMEVCHWVSAVRQTQVKAQSCLGVPPGKTIPQGGTRTISTNQPAVT